jgi:hypothetical protein
MCSPRSLCLDVLVVFVKSRVTRRLEKNICQIFQTIAQKVASLKTQNIYIKPLLKPYNTYNKPCFETVYLGKNVINLLKQKVAQKVAIILGYFIFSKNHNEPPKVAQMAKNCPIWSPWSNQMSFLEAFCPIMSAFQRQ